MSTTTTLFVHDEDDALLLFGHALQAIGAEPGTVQTSHEADAQGYAYLYTNDFDRNLLASLVVARRLNGPLYTRTSAPCGPHWYRLDITTHYTPRTGRTPDLLHSRILDPIAQHLERRGVRWSWTGTDDTHHTPDTARADLNENLRLIERLHADWGRRILSNVTPPAPVLAGTVISSRDRALGTRPRWNLHPHVQDAVLVLLSSPDTTPAPATDTSAGTGLLVSPETGEDTGWIRVEYLTEGTRTPNGMLPSPNPLALARLAYEEEGWSTRMFNDHLRAAPPGAAADTGTHAA